MSESSVTTERLTELLTDEASTGLGRQESSELEELMSTDTGLARDEFMHVASLVQLGFLHSDQRGVEPMPDAFRARLEQQAKNFFAQGQARNDSGTVSDIQSARRAREDTAPKSSRWLNASMTGWYLAAALALAFFVVRGGPDLGSPAAPAEQRATLMAQADVIVAPWAASAATEGYEGVTGDVVWSDERQAGYMRLSGLVANEPATAQYQLWIVDPDRDARPVDGGVFDVPAGAGEVIIPIDPKLEIDGPAAFAITLEKPGGVVVSGGPLLVVAPVAG